ncbi:putative glyoxalase superfamily protein PhnB [Salinibacterium sp. CAN_S4]|uniref:VOC family protein n=1 Tax=Salinibacterium sp. CAN_S4 TaxID=2787727 RepID=UPI0018F02F46
MTVNSIYPVLMSNDVATAAEFYRATFAFEDTFTSDWYVSLRLDRWELAILDAHHETVPESRRGAVASGVVVNIEVSDVDAQYDRISQLSAITIALPLRSEPFGQRHFILDGPDGVLIDVITPIEPEPGFADQFN